MVLVSVLHSSSASGQAFDIETYQALLAGSVEAHDALDNAEEHVPDAPLLEQALSADGAFVVWLDTVIGSPAFVALPEHARQDLVRNRNRVEFRRATVLLQMGRCDDAQAALGTLLESDDTDAEVRPRLGDPYQEAVACALRGAVVTFVVDARPAEAAVYIDGAYLGPSGVENEVSPGSHTVLLRADGYEDLSLSIEATEPGTTVRLGPVELQAVVVASGDDHRPEPVEWALWGTGVVTMAAGIGLLVNAGNVESELEEGVRTVGVVNEARIRDEIGLKRGLGASSLGVGVASTVVGTLLYLRDDADPEGESRARWRVVPQGLGVGVHASF